MRYILLLMVLLFSFADAKPFNSNLLTEKGIDSKILNLSISNTRQDVAVRMKVNSRVHHGEDKNSLLYYIVLNPYPNYGVDIKQQIPKGTKNIDRSAIEKRLDQLMIQEMAVQSGDYYDINSLRLYKSSEEESIISFEFLKDKIPYEQKHFRDMLGYVYVKGSKLDKIEIKNKKSFKLNGVKVDSYLKTLYFKPVSSGGYLLKEITLEISGKKNNLEYHEIRTITALEYWDENQNIISFDKGVLTQKIELKDEKYDTISLDLDRTFPLLGQEARKSGYVLPKPFGVTLINMYQDTTMHMTSFKVDGLDLDINKIVDGDSTYRSLTYAPLVRADVWVLPFVSFSLIVGKTYTSTEVTLASDSGLNYYKPMPGPIPDINKTIIPAGSQISADIKTNAILYGVGATIAGGFDNYFTTIDFQYIISYTESADVKIDIMAITPIVGYRFNEYNTNLFFGAQYQRLAQSLTFDVTGTAPVIGEKRVKGEIGLLSEEWAGLIGVDYSFTRNWSANFLYSQGIDRKNATLGITYRF